MRFLQSIFFSSVLLLVLACENNSPDSLYAIENYSKQELEESFSLEEDSSQGIDDGPWDLVAHGYQDNLFQITPSRDIWMSFSLEGDQVTGASGSDGCNSFWFVESTPTETTYSEDTIFIDGIITTLVACTVSSGFPGEATEQEQELDELYWEQRSFVFDVIKDIQSYELNGGLLTLTNSQSAMIVLAKRSLDEHENP